MSGVENVIGTRCELALHVRYAEFVILEVTVTHGGLYISAVQSSAVEIGRVEQVQSSNLAQSCC